MGRAAEGTGGGRWGGTPHKSRGFGTTYGTFATEAGYIRDLDNRREGGFARQHSRTAATGAGTLVRPCVFVAAGWVCRLSAISNRSYLFLDDIYNQRLSFRADQR